MLPQAVMTAAIETALNQLLKFDVTRQVSLHKLQDLSFKMQLNELDFTVVLVFSSSHIDVVAEPKDTPLTSTNDSCKIISSVFDAKTLSDTSQLTSLIKQGKLDIQGNIQIAQRVSALFGEINIDIEDILSQYIGDVAAFNVVNKLNDMKAFFTQKIGLWRDTISDAAIEEKQIAAPMLAVQHFNDQVDDIREYSDRLAARLQFLESANQSPNVVTNTENKAIANEQDQYKVSK